MSKIEVNAIEPQSGTTLTLGASGDTVALAAGALQSGFGRSGSVNWDTTPKTSGFTAVSGNGYFVNTTSAAITVTLPITPTAGDIVAISDYANTSATNNITVGRNGSLIDGIAVDAIINTNGQVYTLVYVDATEGWKTVGQTFNQIVTAQYVAATGGTITCDGNYKIHTFTGPGTFTVTNAGNASGSNSVEYLVVAGGGGATSYGPSTSGAGGGGGAGGFRFASPSIAPLTYPAKPIAAPSNLPVAAQGYPITVGGGGAGMTPAGNEGASGSVSTFSTITSAGGGGTTNAATGSGKPGGSGGAMSGTNTPGIVGTGNTPPTSPPQGNNGGGFVGCGGPRYATGGGGGAMAVGESINPHNQATGGAGGVGAGVPIAFGSNGQPSGGFRYYAGGGGGTVYPCGTGGAGGLGGGGAGLVTGGTGTAGTTNTGGGGGAAGGIIGGSGGTGGSGIVVIRYKFQ